MIFEERINNKRFELLIHLVDMYNKNTQILSSMLCFVEKKQRANV